MPYSAFQIRALDKMNITLAVEDPDIPRMVAKVQSQEESFEVERLPWSVKAYAKHLFRPKPKEA